MAAIDKIYVNTYEEYLQFKEWCKQQPKLKDKYGVEASLLDYLYKYDSPFKGNHPIFNAPYYLDAYVIRNCPLSFIQEELMLNYGYKSQKTIEEMYKIVMDRGGVQGKQNKDYYYWLTKEDFVVEDGHIYFPDNYLSSYMQIKRGELYSKPYYEEEYVIGKHCRCIKHPIKMYNRPFKTKGWFIDIDTPESLPYMWYHSNHNSWDFMGEFVISEWSSSAANCKTIKAAKRLIRKWKLPVGTIVKITARYSGDDYSFLVTKQKIF